MSMKEIIWKTIAIQLGWWIEEWIYQSICDWMLEEWQQAKVTKMKWNESISITFTPKTERKLLEAIDVIKSFWFERQDMKIFTVKVKQAT